MSAGTTCYRNRLEINESLQGGMQGARVRHGRKAFEVAEGAVHFEHVADGDDALGSVGALASSIESAELVVVQAERQGLSKAQAESAGIDSKEGQAGSVLERGEGLVESESLRKSLSALGTESVLLEAAKERQGGCQWLLTARVLGAMGSILELVEGGVVGDGVGHVLCPLWLEVVPLEAVNE